MPLFKESLFTERRWVASDAHMEELPSNDRGNRWGPEGPPTDVYSRVTDAERFRPLHAAMLEIVGRLERNFEVERRDGYGLEDDLEEIMYLDCPSIWIKPKDPDAAPIGVAFSNFPGLYMRFGRWYKDAFPSCGCDACDETAEIEIERLNEMVEDVIAGRFRESLRRPLLSAGGSSWHETEFWSSIDRRLSRGCVDRVNADRMSGGRRRVDLDWKAWRRRQVVG